MRTGVAAKAQTQQVTRAKDIGLRLAHEGADVIPEVVRFSSFAIGFAALPLLASPQAHAASFMKTDAGLAVHWQPGTVSIGVDSAATSGELSPAAIALAIDEAAAAWNVVPEMRLSFVRAKAAETPAVVIRFCKGKWAGKQNLLGQTQFQAAMDTGLVKQASIEINECDFRFVGPEDVAPEHLDLQAVLTHELGHVMGLDHTADDTAVMHSCTGTIHTRRPTMDDRRGLAMIYGEPKAPPVAQTPTMMTPVSIFDAEPVFLTGRNGMLGFELPWPELSNAHPVRFVPTVVPLPPRHHSASARPKLSKPLPPKPLTQGLPARTKTRPTGDTAQEPKASEMPWPEPDTAAEATARRTSRPGKASR